MAPAASGAQAQGNQLCGESTPAVDSQANHKNLLAGGLARGVAFSALTLAVAPFILTAPAHAADDNTVSIAVDQNATLKQTGNLYKATTNVTVKTGKPYGFNLTMQADTADLVNSKDPTHKISATPSSTPVALNANQWGYSLSKSATTFSAVPAGAQATPAVVADVTKAKPAGCTNPANCTKQVTFAANVDPAKLASGSYSTSIIYTATAKPKPAFIGWEQRTAKIDPSEVCRSGDDNSSCLVDLDKNMIPVKYTGSTVLTQWTSVADPESTNSGWYDYTNKQWANAVTVKSEAVSKYRGLNKVIDQTDILGYWVYIPRYRYEVLRFGNSDSTTSPQNFVIDFENKQSYKDIPSANYMWATHPAFTFGKKELNGIWVAKYKTTGTVSLPTVLPYESHISGNTSSINNAVGNFYSLAKSFGIVDRQNVGGGSVSFFSNTHNLSKLSSRMVNNSDWGAVAYLATSKYGAGYNNLRLDGNTTNNSTGIEGMLGGDSEYVAAGYTENSPQSYSDRYFSAAAREPYVNTYNFIDMKGCTFNTCGGQALYEVQSSNGSQWGNGYATFVGYYMSDPCSLYHYDSDCERKRVYVQWFKRGGRNNGNMNMFSAFAGDGYVGSNDAFRVTLGDFRQN